MAAHPADRKIRKALTYLYIKNEDCAAARKLLGEKIALRATADNYYAPGYVDLREARLPTNTTRAAPSWRPTSRVPTTVWR